MNEKARFTQTRGTERFAPKQPVTVAISNDSGPLSYGVIANLSEGGACFQTNLVPKASSVHLVLSFYDGEYVRATGRVVWSESGDGMATLGVEFTGLSDQVRDSLRSRFGSPTFARL